VFARPGGTTCSHGGAFTLTGLPLASVIESMGVGGHHMPPEDRVAATLDSSTGSTASGPRVNEARFCFLNFSAMLRPGSSLGWVA